MNRRVQSKYDGGDILPDATIMEIMFPAHLFGQEGNANKFVFKDGVLPDMWKQSLYLFSWLIHKYDLMFSDKRYRDGTPMFLVVFEDVVTAGNETTAGVRLRLVLQYHAWVEEQEAARREAAADEVKAEVNDADNAGRKHKPRHLTLATASPGYLLAALAKSNEGLLSGEKERAQRVKHRGVSPPWVFLKTVVPSSYELLAVFMSGMDGAAEKGIRGVGNRDGDGPSRWVGKSNILNPLNVWSLSRSMRAVQTLDERKCMGRIDRVYSSIDAYRKPLYEDDDFVENSSPPPSPPLSPPEGGEGGSLYTYPRPARTFRIQPAALFPGRLDSFIFPRQLDENDQITPASRTLLMGLVNQAGLSDAEFEQSLNKQFQTARECLWWNQGVEAEAASADLDSLRTSVYKGLGDVRRKCHNDKISMTHEIYLQRVRAMYQFGPIWSSHGNMPDSLKAIAGWGEAYLSSHQNFCMPRLPSTSNLSALGDIVLQDHIDLKFAMGTGTLSRQATLVLKCAFHVYNLGSKLNPHVLMHGPAAQGKSFIFTKLVVILIPGTVKNVTIATQRAEVAEGAESKIDVQIMVMDDVAPSTLGIGVAPATKGSQAGNSPNDMVRFLFLPFYLFHLLYLLPLLSHAFLFDFLILFIYTHAF